MFIRTSIRQKHAAALYAQAADFNKTARFYYMKAQDAYYLANAQVFGLFGTFLDGSIYFSIRDMMDLV